MNLNQKLIKPKIGLLELAKSLGNISAACKQWAIAVIVIIDSNNYMKLVVTRHYMRSVVESRY